MGVAVVVNALGDIFQDGVKIAGMTTTDRKGFVSAEQAVLMNQYSDLIAGNTTIAAVFTNARLSIIVLRISDAYSLQLGERQGFHQTFHILIFIDAVCRVHS